MNSHLQLYLGLQFISHQSDCLICCQKITVQKPIRGVVGGRESKHLRCELKLCICHTGVSLTLRLVKSSPQHPAKAILAQFFKSAVVADHYYITLQLNGPQPYQGKTILQPTLAQAHPESIVCPEKKSSYKIKEQILLYYLVSSIYTVLVPSRLMPANLVAGDFDKQVKSKLIVFTNPRLFIRLIQAIC